MRTSCTRIHSMRLILILLFEKAVYDDETGHGIYEKAVEALYQRVRLCRILINMPVGSRSDDSNMYMKTIWIQNIEKVNQKLDAEISATQGKEDF